MITTPNRRIAMRLCAALLAATMVASCGSGNGTGGAPRGGGPGLQPTFDSIQANVFDVWCTSCHIGATAPLRLRLDAASSFGLLVGIPSEQAPSLLRVDPFDPDNSYLIRKLEGTQSDGQQMPLDGPALPQADIDVIRQWIREGALPGGQLPQGPIRVSALDPPPGSVMPMLPMTIRAIFDREVDPSTVSSSTFLVRRSGGDGTFGDLTDVPITPVSVTVLPMNAFTVEFDMSTTAPVEDVYEVTLIGSNIPPSIQDFAANPLDGEFGGAFPSGDGVAGGNFVATFEVAGIQPTLDSIQDNVFTPLCAGCHTGPPSNNASDLPSALPLTDAGTSFANLVGVSSLLDGAIDRVEPNDPDASLLIQKLEGTAPGFQMPLGGPALDQATIDTIRLWIANGASM